MPDQVAISKMTLTILQEAMIDKFDLLDYCEILESHTSVDEEKSGYVFLV